MEKYRIRCGDRYYCGMAWKDGKAYQRWEKESDFPPFPLEMNATDALCTLQTLSESGKYIEMPVIEDVRE